MWLLQELAGYPVVHGQWARQGPCPPPGNWGDRHLPPSQRRSRRLAGPEDPELVNPIDRSLPRPPRPKEIWLAARLRLWTEIAPGEPLLKH